MPKQPQLPGKLGEGSCDYQLVDATGAQPGDIVLPKPRYSGLSITAGQHFAPPWNTPSGFHRYRYQRLRHRRYAMAFFWSIRRGAGKRNTPGGPEFPQKAALFNIETFFGWVSDVETFCDALSPHPLLVSLRSLTMPNP